MKNIIIVLLLLLAIPVQAETGIVLNASGYVQYKYDTDTRPTLQPGEYIVPYEDISSILKDAKYDGTMFFNPEPPMFAQYEEKLVAVSATGLDPVTQAAINFAAGGAGAYLVVRRKKPQPP